ncbi:MAG: DUF2127 domain-containing protein [Verrucomicrobiota bacterium]|nr:DUF2127 domain-containing protein [Verrucomicrobiota bacterium]
MKRTAAKRTNWLHWAFETGIWLKGIDGALELIGGCLFLIIRPSALNRIVAFLTQHELQEDPDDLVANALRHASDHLSSGSKLIGAAYLLAHGALKVFLAAGILRGKLWCYPTAIALMGMLALLEIVRAAFHFSIPLFAAAGVDIIIVALIWREYRLIRKSNGRQGGRSGGGVNSQSR